MGKCGGAVCCFGATCPHGMLADLPCHSQLIELAFAASSKERQGASLPGPFLSLIVARSRRLDDSAGACAVNRGFGDTRLLTCREREAALGYAYWMRTAEAAIAG